MGACGLSVYYSCQWVWASNGYSHGERTSKGLFWGRLAEGHRALGKEGAAMEDFHRPPACSKCVLI